MITTIRAEYVRVGYVLAFPILSVRRCTVTEVARKAKGRGIQIKLACQCPDGDIVHFTYPGMKKVAIVWEGAA